MKYNLLLMLLFGVVNVSYASAAPTITVDKKAGTISVYYPDTDKTITEPALIGKVKSDTLNMATYDNLVKSDYVTPAGTFEIVKMFSWRLNEPMLTFIRGKEAVSAIHPLWMGNPDQKRVQRLQSPTPEDNRITGGCINVDSKFFYSVLDKLPDHGVELKILPEWTNLNKRIL